ncbi:MAG: SPOR domain-containing protein [Candidatus Omnitrophica bacterium]|nr:SPOR domain-containing protein [Candidatus Omnitrophota bacterium]
MKKFIIPVFILSLLVFSAVNAYAYTCSEAMNPIIKSILAEDYYKALDECYVLEKKSTADLKGEIFFTQGVCLMGVGEYEQAREVFKKALNYARGELSTEVYISIADTYFQGYDYDKAVNIYEQLLNSGTNNDYQAMLYFKIGKAYQKKSEWTKSGYYFDKLKNQFPRSFETHLAQAATVAGNFFTIQVGCFSSNQNAQKLYQELKTKGYEAYITPFESRGKTLYRVRVGEFVSRVAAEYTEKELRARENLPTHIFP